MEEKTVHELADMIAERIGIGITPRGYVVVNPDPDFGWHPTVVGAPSEAQQRAEEIAKELRPTYELKKDVGGFMTINLGNFVRRTSSKDAALDAVSRLITIEDCNLKYHDGVRQSEPYQALNEAASHVGPYIMIEVYDPETRSRNDASFKDWIAPHILGGASERSITLYPPRSFFDQVWAAAQARSLGGSFQMHLRLKVDPPQLNFRPPSFSVTEATLIEKYMSPTPEHAS